MKFLITSLLAAAALTSASPVTRQTIEGFPPNCLSYARAQYIIEREIAYLRKADLADARAAGEELFAADFVQYGDSINSLRGDPVSPPPHPHYSALHHTYPSYFPN